MLIRTIDSLITDFLTRIRLHGAPRTLDCCGIFSGWSSFEDLTTGVQMSYYTFSPVIFVERWQMVSSSIVQDNSLRPGHVKVMHLTAGVVLIKSTSHINYMLFSFLTGHQVPEIFQIMFFTSVYVSSLNTCINVASVCCLCLEFWRFWRLIWMTQVLRNRWKGMDWPGDYVYVTGWEAPNWSSKLLFFLYIRYRFSGLLSFCLYQPFRPQHSAIRSSCFDSTSQHILRRFLTKTLPYSTWDCYQKQRVTHHQVEFDRRWIVQKMLMHLEMFAMEVLKYYNTRSVILSSISSFKSSLVTNSGVAVPHVDALFPLEHLP